MSGVKGFWVVFSCDWIVAALFSITCTAQKGHVTAYCYGTMKAMYLKMGGQIVPMHHHHRTVRITAALICPAASCTAWRRPAGPLHTNAEEEWKHLYCSFQSWCHLHMDVYMQ